MPFLTRFDYLLILIAMTTVPNALTNGTMVWAALISTAVLVIRCGLKGLYRGFVWACAYVISDIRKAAK